MHWGICGGSYELSYDFMLIVWSFENHHSFPFGGWPSGDCVIISKTLDCITFCCGKTVKGFTVKASRVGRNLMAYCSAEWFYWSRNSESFTCALLSYRWVFFGISTYPPKTKSHKILLKSRISWNDNCYWFCCARILSLLAPLVPAPGDLAPVWLPVRGRQF